MRWSILEGHSFSEHFETLLSHQSKILAILSYFFRTVMCIDLLKVLLSHVSMLIQLIYTKNIYNLQAFFTSCYYSYKTKTCLYNFDLLKPYIYIVKL